MEKNNKLSPFEFSCMIFFPILAMFSGIGIHNIIKVSKVDAYISVIISYLIGIVVLGLFLYIFNYRKDLSLDLKIKYLFGKYFGFVINYLIIFLVMVIGVVLLYNISNFAISQFLSDTPMVVFMILFGIVLIYNVKLGIKNISRVSIVFFAIVCLLTIISTTGAMVDFELSNLKPVLENGVGGSVKGGFIMTMTNVIPIFTLLSIPRNNIDSKKKINKNVFIFYTIAYIFAFVAIVLTLGSLGIYLCELYQYPEYTVLKKISLFNFIDRIENFIYIKWIFNSVICLSLIIYYVSSSVHKKSKSLLPTILMIILVLGATFVFKNNTIFYEFGYNIFPYANLMLLSIFVIIGINIFIRKRLLNEE